MPKKSPSPSEPSWQQKLPFLKWTSPDGKIAFAYGPDGKCGFPHVDGSVIAFRSDPRLAEYEDWLDACHAERLREMAEVVKRVYQRVVDKPEPFPVGFVCKHPQFMRWLNGDNPNYRPTVMEARVLDGAYAERLRMLKERGLSRQTDDIEAGLSSGAAGFKSASDLATEHGLPCEALRHRLQRWRKQNGQGWMEVSSSERGPRDAQFLYRPDAVAEVVNSMRRE